MLKMNLIKVFVFGVSLAVAGQFFYKFIIFYKPNKTIFEHSPGPCLVMTSAAEGSEDVTSLRNGKVLITTGLRFKTSHFPDRKGKILLFDFHRPQEVTEVKIEWKDAKRFESFNPHGIDAFEVSPGKFVVFIVNHDPHESVERFSFDEKNNKLVHLESILDANFHLLNSVAAYGARQFYFTNYQYFNKGIMLQWEPHFLNLGSLGCFDGAVATIVKSGYNVPNGLALSRDKRKLYLANVGELALDTFEITAGPNITFSHSLYLDTSIDNIQVDPLDGALWLGCHPSRWAIMQYFKDPFSRISPSQVLKVKVNDKGYPLGGVTEVYSNKGDEISASAVAIHYERKLLIGSVCQNLVVCDVKW